MRLLAVDTALGACSVAVLDGEEVLANRFVAMERGHAELVAPMVAEAMAAARLTYAALDRLAVTVGPGTFTGQRVGLAFMRGLRVALKKPLTGVTTLAAMARQAMAETGLETAAALHDARRDEVYLEIAGVTSAEPAVLSFDDAVARLVPIAGPLALAGTAAPEAVNRLPRAVLSTVRQPDALWVARIARDLPPTEVPPKPLYLRAPDARLPLVPT
ncbi:MAG TPA: tRNA (adenosine(37)-N6)-threonylcarbamoyltransferase complex dimerization subunit type 1 TsaB [Rhizomicrobium sp.]|nr:tRNA (adenosine(37)-N6)-threonylcarbamoyltransferase complex dimerization subunit type 1 TsaB [Rhizomicrobium sp.]